MEIFVALLIGMIIGSTITYLSVQKSQQRRTTSELKNLRGEVNTLQQNLPKKAYNIKEIQQTYARAYTPWTKDDDERLKQRYHQGATINDLVKEFQRQPGGIRSRLKKLGLLE